ncbi:GldG family protein [Pelagicoccus sp. SDUM812003]|uniref:GldG family protein n=1 Tax=Pelagicoccus sp. SDUM812003 TaxID=3041267 RepID=UPI00280E5D36|nr:GldG family protein [Pelagicoccus sp. SDUM812003]MDQ8205168.1 GldG family protein [Pelagicoccus sp. SDUM812003]
MKLSRKLVASLLILANFIFLHYIVSSIPLRFDLTEENIYTLSDSTKSMLDKIEEPVTVDFYSSRSVEELPAWFKTFADRVEQMLEQYERASGGLVTLNVIDPKPDTEEEERAIAAGLHGQEIATGDRVFLGMVVAQGDTEKTHPFFNWNRENFLEYDISRTIYETQLLTKPRIGLITTLPLIAPPYPTMPGQPQQQEDQFFITQLESQFAFESIEPTATELPSDIDMLAIVHPKNLNEELQYAIDQFALTGKPIFLAVDPSSIQEKEQSRQMQMMGGQMNQDTSSDLPKLLDAWGIEYDRRKVLIEPNNSIAQANFVQPAWIVFQDEYTNRELLPSSELEGVLTLESAPLIHREDATTEWEPVLTTTDEAATVEGMMLQFQQGNALWENATSLERAVAVAGLLRGPAKTAFPGGPPSAEEQDSAEESEDAKQTDQLQEGSINVFVIGDTDWLLDRFSIQKVNFLGMQQIQKMNDNLGLAANFIEYLGGSRDLIGLRGKGDKDRSFDVVQAMEAEAQKAYQAKLEAVEAEIEEINSKLSQLVSEQTDTGVIYATPEMQEAIDEFKERQAAAKAERRLIRRDLRQGIETLGNVVGAINLLWAPIALALFGLYFFRSRKG